MNPIISSRINKSTKKEIVQCNDLIRVHIQGKNKINDIGSTKDSKYKESDCSSNNQGKES